MLAFCKFAIHSEQLLLSCVLILQCAGCPSVKEHCKWKVHHRAVPQVSFALDQCGGANLSSLRIKQKISQKSRGLQLVLGSRFSFLFHFLWSTQAMATLQSSERCGCFGTAMPLLVRTLQAGRRELPHPAPVSGRSYFGGRSSPADTVLSTPTLRTV